MTVILGGLVRRTSGLLRRDGIDEAELLRRTSLVLYVLLVIGVTPVWVGTYLVLDRPLATLLPMFYAVLSIGGLTWFWTTGRFAAFRATQIGAILVLPMLLQASLGGFVHASAVALWSFSAPVGALFFYGSRAAGIVFAAFVAGVVGLAALDPALSAAAEPMPALVVTAFFGLNTIAPLAAAFALLMFVSHRREQASARSEELLLSILPASVAARMKAGERTIADAHPDVTILFADLVRFTPFAERTPAERVVELLNSAFSGFDVLAERLGLEKMKTWGDAYIVAGGLPDPRPDHAEAVAELALSMPSELLRCVGDAWPDARLRIGIHTGPVVAGVIGRRKFSYDAWGDTVNTAARMQEYAAPGSIQLSAATAERLRGRYELEPLAQVDIKGKGPMQTYLLTGRATAPATSSAVAASARR